MLSNERQAMRTVAVKDKPNTYVYYNNSYHSFVLHNTTIVRYNPFTSKVILNTGGWYTVTTKRRMNEIFNEHMIPLQVFQKDFEWYVYRVDKDETISFCDNMEINFDRRGGSK